MHVRCADQDSRALIAGAKRAKVWLSSTDGLPAIALAGSLPEITAPVILDATTQPGFAGAPIIELNGAGAGTARTGS